MKPPWLDETLTAARDCGAAEAEGVLTHEVSLQIEVAKGQVETLALSEDIGLGVRVFTADRKMGFAYTTDLGSGVTRVVGAAWANAAASSLDEHNVLLGEDTVSEDTYGWKFPPDMIGGIMVHTMEELKEKIRYSLAHPDCCREQSERFVRDHMGGSDGHICERIERELRMLIGNRG